MPGIGIGIRLGANGRALPFDPDPLRGTTSFFGLTTNLPTVFQADGVTPISAPDQQISLQRDGFDPTNTITYSQATAGDRPLSHRQPKVVRNLLTGSDTMATQTRPVTAAQHRLSFQGTGTVTLTGASTAGPLVGTGASDIVGLTFTPTAGNLTLTVSGTVELAQLELGSVRTAYQSRGTTQDTTEAGQPTFWFNSFNGSNQVVDTPALDAGDYTVILPGPRGIYISPTVTLGAGDTIRTGPLSVTKNGTTVIPEIPLVIMRATSTAPYTARFPLASPAILAKAPLTQAEINKVLRRYQAEGCGGLLVEGATELFSNFDFASDSVWAKTAGISWSGGQYTVQDIAGVDNFIAQQVTAPAGSCFLHTLDIDSVINPPIGGAGLRIRIGTNAGGAQGGDGLFIEPDPAGQVVRYITPVANFANPWFTFLASNTDKGVVLNSWSVRLLNPEALL